MVPARRNPGLPLLARSGEKAPRPALHLSLLMATPPSARNRISGSHDPSIGSKVPGTKLCHRSGCRQRRPCELPQHECMLSGLARYGVLLFFVLAASFCPADCIPFTEAAWSCLPETREMSVTCANWKERTLKSTADQDVRQSCPRSSWSG